MMNDALASFGAALAVLIGVFLIIRDLRTELEQRIEGIETRLDAKIDSLRVELKGDIGQLTERYITHLEHHPR